MFTRFQLLYLISVNSRANGLPKYFSDLDLNFTYFYRMKICYSNSFITLCTGFKNFLILGSLRYNSCVRQPRITQTDRQKHIYELSVFKVIYLSGYVLRIDFLKLLNNDDEKCIKHSTVNQLDVQEHISQQFVNESMLEFFEFFSLRIWSQISTNSSNIVFSIKFQLIHRTFL